MMRNVFKKVAVVGVAIAAMVMGAQKASAVVMADLVFVVDESGSMGGVQANLRDNVGTFASILSAGGVDARYALVGYGSSTIRPRLLTDLTDAGTFATVAQGLLVNGGTEPAYESIMAALNGGPSGPIGAGISFRSGAVKNVIIFTDEGSSGDLAGATFSDADNLLSAENALLNGVLTSGSAGIFRNGGTLGDLVTTNGGFVFDLNAFNTTDQLVIDAFVQDFAQRKLQEIITRGGGVPEPITATLGLMGLGVLASAARRRRVA